MALVAGALLLITRRVGPEPIYGEIDWSLPVMFIGLFIVVAGVERPAVLSAWAAVPSNIVSNVPAVLIFKPIVLHLPDPRHAWLVLAMSSTLAGNLTVLGSVANLIVIERARREANISFREYAKVGIPVTVVTLAIAIAPLSEDGPTQVRLLRYSIAPQGAY